MVEHCLPLGRRETISPLGSSAAVLVPPTGNGVGKPISVVFIWRRVLENWLFQMMGHPVQVHLIKGQETISLFLSLKALVVVAAQLPSDK